MPIYEYERADGTRFDLRQNFSDDPLETDPETGQKVRRVFSARSSGYPSTDSFATSYKGGSKAKKASGSK